MKTVTQHRIVLRGSRVDYNVIVSGAARQTRVRVGPSGVEVVKPAAASDGDVSAFLRRNESWVLAQINRVANLRAVRQPPRRKAGEIMYRGDLTRVRVEIVDTKARGNHVAWNDGEIVIRRGPETQTPAERGLENWLRRQARSAITGYLPVVTAQIGREPARVYVMDQRTKWGNCSPRGNLSFNWRLILAPDFVLRYLVTHEVVHLVVPDHSAKFWLTVQSLCPDMERAKQWLGRYLAELTMSLADVISTIGEDRGSPW